MTGPYDAADLNAARIEQWRDDDLALLEYMPKWRGGGGDASRLLLDFKDEVPQAQAEAIDRSLRAFSRFATSLRKLGLRYVVSIPRSGAGKINVGAEAIAAAVSEAHPWLRHAPRALQRTKTVPKSRYVRQPIEVHLDSIAYAGPQLRRDPRAVVGRETCHACEVTFRSQYQLEQHVARDPAHPAAVAFWAKGVAVLIVDDLITDGNTSGACRQHLELAGARRVFGLFLARTFGR
jgi:hypothetical protein